MSKLTILVLAGLLLTGCGHVKVPPPPPPPASPTVTVRWNPQSEVQYFNVYRDGTLVGSATANVFLDQHPARKRVNTYTVTAVNVAGESKMSSPSYATVP